MVILNPEYSLAEAKAEYTAIADLLLRQSIIGAPGLGKGCATGELINLGFIESKQAGVYEFSSRLMALAKRRPEHASEIIPRINAGVMVPPRYVRMAYEDDRSDAGFGIDSKIAQGLTVMDDGLPRSAGKDEYGKPLETNQVEMLRQVHGSNSIYD